MSDHDPGSTHNPDADILRLFNHPSNAERIKDDGLFERLISEGARHVLTDEGMQVRPLPKTETQAAIAQVCDEIKDFLIAKNQQYGNSALDPVRIFSKSSTEEQLLVRIDDKLSRLVRGDDSIEPDDEIINDLIGYLVLLKVARS